MIFGLRSSLNGKGSPLIGFIESSLFIYNLLMTLCEQMLGHLKWEQFHPTKLYSPRILQHAKRARDEYIEVPSLCNYSLRRDAGL